MSKNDNPIIEPCAPATMFARLKERGLGRVESAAYAEVIVLPTGVALVQEQGGLLWGGMRKGALGGWHLTLPRNRNQRQGQRSLRSRNWIALIETPEAQEVTTP